MLREERVVWFSGSVAGTLCRGPGDAVQPHPIPGDLLPQPHHQLRRQGEGGEHRRAGRPHLHLPAQAGRPDVPRRHPAAAQVGGWMGFHIVQSLILWVRVEILIMRITTKFRFWFHRVSQSWDSDYVDYYKVQILISQVITELRSWLCGYSQSLESDFGGYHRVEILIMQVITKFRFWFHRLSQSWDSDYVGYHTVQSLCYHRVKILIMQIITKFRFWFHVMDGLWILIWWVITEFWFWF